MPLTVNQHYVPRFYLKPFCKVINPNTKKEKCFISFYQFKDELMKEGIPTTSICSEDYFYDEDGSIENALAVKESKEWSVAFKKIIHEEELEERDFNYIREFTRYQISSTKAMLIHSQEMAATILTDTLYNESENLDKEIIHNMVSKKVEGEITPEFNLKIVKESVPVIEDLKIEILTNKTGTPFFLSDVPVVVTNPFGIHRAGLGSIGTIIFFPISQEKMITLYDGKMYGEIEENIYDESIVQAFNKYQFVGADERIMALHVQEFEGYIADEELMAKRLVCQEANKTNTINDGVGIFIAAKSRSIGYYFDISIFKLPKQLKKIPTDFREVFPREYSYETRRAILCRVYREPDFIDNPILKNHWKKSQEYSKKLLAYLDHYWSTPKEDCIITPELMKMLKTVPVSSFFNKNID